MAKVLDVSARRLVATEEDQKHLNFQEDSISTRILVAQGNSETKAKIWSQSESKMKDLDVNAAVWCFLMSVALQAAVHFSTDCTENLRSESLRQLFQLTQKLITDRTEITGITTIDWRQLVWREMTLLTGRAVQFAIAKTFVFF